MRGVTLVQSDFVTITVKLFKLLKSLPFLLLQLRAYFGPQALCEVLKGPEE